MKLPELNLLIKADTQGTAEAVRDSVMDLSNEVVISKNEN